MTDAQGPESDAPATAYSDRLRRAADPATPQSELAELASAHAELRPLIAANPSAYPGLLEWLASLGEPAVLAAISARSAVTAPAQQGGGYLAELSGGLAKAPAGTVVVRNASAEQPAPQPRRLRGGQLAAIAGAVVAALVIGGGVFAVNGLLGAGASATDSAKAFPATTFSWQEIAIDPSLGQKLALAQVIEALPELKDLLEDDGPRIDYEQPDLKHSLWDYVFGTDEFRLASSLDYDHDIEPWLGSRVGYGLVSDVSSSTEAPYFVVEATDVAAGVEAVVAMIEDFGGVGFQVSSMNGYVVISSDALDLKRAFENGTLADSKAFQASTARIGGWGLAAYWASPYAAMSAQLAWAGDTFGGQSLADFEDAYRSDAESWREEVATFAFACPANATFISSYCRNNTPLSEEGFYDNYGYYPGQWQSAAAGRYQESLDEGKRITDSAQAVIEAVGPDASVAGAVRIDGGAVELVVATAGLAVPEFARPQHSSAMAELPESTIAAASLSQFGSIADDLLSPEYYAFAFANQFTGGGYAGLPYLGGLSYYGYQGYYQFSSLVSYEGESFPQLIDSGRRDFEDNLKRNLGIRFPDDLNSLFGTNAVIAVDQDFSCDVRDFTYSDGACSQPGVGLLIYSANPGDTATSIAELENALDESYDANLSVTESDGRVAVSRGGYGESLLVEPAARLRGDPSFSRVVPGLADSFAAAYVDVRALISEVRDQGRNYSSERLDFLDYFEGIESAGLTISNLGNGDLTMRVRVLVGIE